MFESRRLNVWDKWKNGKVFRSNYCFEIGKFLMHFLVPSKKRKEAEVK